MKPENEKNSHIGQSLITRYLRKVEKPKDDSEIINPFDIDLNSGEVEFYHNEYCQVIALDYTNEGMTSYLEETTSHMIPCVEKDTIERIRQYSIGIVGLGSVGSYTSSAMARLGVHRLDLYDGDEYSIENMDKQAIDLRSIGKNKANDRANRLALINPYVQVEAHPKNLEDADIEEIVTNNDIIIASFDDLTILQKLHHEAYRQGKIIIYPLDLGHDVHIEVYDYRIENKKRKLYNGKIKDEQVSKMVRKDPHNTNDFDIIVHSSRKVPTILRYPQGAIRMPERLARMADKKYIDSDNIPQSLVASFITAGLSAHIIISIAENNPQETIWISADKSWNSVYNNMRRSIVKILKVHSRLRNIKNK
jgi:molybdopterin/thiamine biosynthesis adenylyltransferase